MVLIIFEGPEGSGKTTMSTMLSKLLGIPMWCRPEWLVSSQCVKPELFRDFVEDEHSILKEIDWNKVDLIVDRYPTLSEHVYAFLRRNDYYCAMIPEGNVLVVYLTRTSANRKKGVEKFTYDDLMGELEQRGTKVLRVWNVGKTKQQVLDEILAGVCPQVFPQEKLKVLAVLAKEKGEGDKK